MNRDAVARRVFMRLANYFADRGWKVSDGPKTMLVMRRDPQTGIEHKLMVDEPVSPDMLPSKQQLGLSCSVNFYFEELERVLNSVFGYDPETYGKVSASISLCQVLPKEACHLGVYLVTVGSEDSSKRLVRDYAEHLEPVVRRLEHLSVFDQQDYVPPAVSSWAWNMRRAAYYRLTKSRDFSMKYFQALEREADETLNVIGNPPAQKELVFGTVAKVVEAGKQRTVAEAKRMASTLRVWAEREGISGAVGQSRGQDGA
jgi:hypothetical protein